MAESINELISISGKKKVLLEGMLRATNKQSDAIDKEDMGRLNHLIGEKQKMINTINVLDLKFEGCFTKIKESLGLDNLGDIVKSDNEGLNELKHEISEIMKVVNEIKNVESKNHEKILAQKEELARKIKEIRNGKMARNTYKGKTTTSPNPSFIDKKK